MPTIDWGAIVNMGSAGAVIVTVVYFLRAMEKRDDKFTATLQEQAKQWQAFFTAINADGKEDIRTLAETMSRMVASLDQHDRTVNERVVKTLERIDGNTTPRSTRAKQ